MDKRDPAGEAATRGGAEAGSTPPDRGRPERARTDIEALAAQRSASLPAKVGTRSRRRCARVRPVARQLAEVRGLMNQANRRLERLEGDVLAERHARVDDLALLVELVTSGWKGVDAKRLRLETAAGPRAAGARSRSKSAPRTANRRRGSA